MGLRQKENTGQRFSPSANQRGVYMKQIIALSAAGEMFITQEDKTELWVKVVDKRIKKAIARIYKFKSWQLRP